MVSCVIVITLLGLKQDNAESKTMFSHGDSKECTKEASSVDRGNKESNPLEQ